MNVTEEKVIRNIIQIRISKNLTQKQMADKLKTSEATYSRIESGITALSYAHLTNIASVVGMSVIDIISYPDTYTIKDSNNSDSIEAVLQLKLKDKKKEQVLRIVFGESNLEILNK
jgi:transcriptional regulator with XRE-family HTH domain